MLSTVQHSLLLSVNLKQNTFCLKKFLTQDGDFDSFINVTLCLDFGTFEEFL